LNRVALAAAVVAPLVALVFPGGWVAVPVGWAAVWAAWRHWGSDAWVAGLLAAAATAAWAPSMTLAAALTAALLVGAHFPQWGAAALGASLVAVHPLPALASLALGIPLAFVPAFAAPRQGRPQQGIRAVVMLAAVALLALGFLVPPNLPLGTSLALGGVAALLVATGAGAVVAWRAQSPKLLSWCLAPLVVAPFALAPMVQVSAVGALAAFGAAAAVQAPVLLRVGTRGLDSAQVVTMAALALSWSLAFLVRSG
jgi:hypothetical protein